jgi:hypothetical protein
MVAALSIAGDGTADEALLALRAALANTPVSGALTYFIRLISIDLLWSRAAETNAANFSRAIPTPVSPAQACLIVAFWTEQSAYGPADTARLESALEIARQTPRADENLDLRNPFVD